MKRKSLFVKTIFMEEQLRLFLFQMIQLPVKISDLLPTGLLKSNMTINQS